jgi:threonine dehydrogenase-like Zn-dependent dehydrogenase
MVIPFKDYFLKEITLKCSFAYTDNDFKETVDAFLAGGPVMHGCPWLGLTSLAEKFKGFETMVTDRIHLDDIVKQGFDELMEHKDKHVKIMVTPDTSKV